MIKHGLLFIVAIFLLAHGAQSQQSVGIGTNSPNPRSVLQLVSPTQNQGFLLPKLTTLEITAMGLTPSDRGIMVYDSLLNQIRYWNGGAWLTVSTGTSLGTVTSVGLSLPSIFTVTGSPVTTSGTLTGNLNNQTANTFFAGPDAGIPATPTFRILVPNDIPNLNASKITTGTLPIARGGTGAGTAADARTNLGLGNMALQNATAVTITGGTISGLTTPLGVGSGGTGTNSVTLNGVAYGGAGLITYTAAGTSGQILQVNGSGQPEFVSPNALGWGLTGNSGISSATNFIGTSDAQDLRIRTNNLERVSILSTGNVGIGTTNPLARFSVGASSQFRVDNVGNLTRLNNVPYNWPNANGIGVLTNDGAGSLVWAPLTISGDNGITVSGTSVALGGNMTLSETPLSSSIDNRILIQSSNSALNTVAGIRLRMFDGSIAKQWDIVSRKRDNVAASGQSDFLINNVFSTIGGFIESFKIDGSNSNVIINADKTSASPYGNFIVENGNVGIGISTPTARLHTTGTVRFSGLTGGPGVVTADALGNLSVVAGASVTGSGAANKVAYWNTTGSLTSSTQFHWDNANENLGIGWSAPERNLHLHRAAALDVFAKFTNTSTFVGAGNGFEIGINSTPGDVLLRNYENTSMQFYTNNTERMRISEVGNVGIGTTIPEARFHLAGAVANNLQAHFTQGVTDGGFKLSASNGVAGGAGTKQAEFGMFYSGAGYGSSFNFYRGSGATDGSLAINTNGAERMRVISNGNVGIGTSAPTTKFSVAPGLGYPAPTLGVASGAFSILSDNGLYGLYSGVSTTGNTWFQVMRNDAVATAYGILLNPSGGNVAIGTTSANAPLQFANTTSNRKIVLFESANNDHQFYGLGINNNMMRFQVNSAVDSYAFFAGTSSTTSNELMRIQGDGNVSVGANSAAYRFNVAGGLDASENILMQLRSPFISAGTSTGLRLANTTNTNGSVAFVDLLSTRSPAGDFLIKPNGTERLRLTATGNLGIGTATPNAPLQFSNDIVNRKIVLYESANNDHQYYGFGINGSTLRYQVDALAANHVFYAASSTTASNELMRINGNGRVGIGTNAPNSILDISGPSTAPQNLVNLNSANTWGTALNIGNSSSNTAYQLITAGNAHPSLSSGSFALASLASGNLITADGTSGDMSIGALTALTTNKIGIGTNPTGSSKVFISNSDNSFSDGMWLSQNRSSGGVVYGLYNTNSNNTGSSTTFGLFNSSSGTSTGAKYGVYSTTGGSGTRYAFYGVGNAFLTGGTTWTTSDERLKNNVVKFDNALAILDGINTYNYTFKREGLYESFQFPEGNQYGFLAGELEKVLPSFVHEADHPVPADLERTPGQQEVREPRMVTFKAVNYQGMIPILTQAIKEQQVMIEELKKEVEILKKK